MSGRVTEHDSWRAMTSDIESFGEIKTVVLSYANPRVFLNVPLTANIGPSIHALQSQIKENKPNKKKARLHLSPDCFWQEFGPRLHVLFGSPRGGGTQLPVPVVLLIAMHICA